jgi:hypothetical protein
MAEIIDSLRQRVGVASVLASTRDRGNLAMRSSADV